MKKILLVTLRNCKPFLVLLILLKLLSIAVCGQELLFSDDKLNYRQIFQDRYDEALKYLGEKKWISDSLRAKGIDPDFAIAIVFPEIIRYSSIQDKMEVGSLLTLYVQYGEKYSDFSVGRFQMKPSFVEQLENEIEILENIDIKVFNISNTTQARMERVNRLNDEKWQVNYLVLFLKSMNLHYGYIQWKDENEKLEFFATAYNSGYRIGEAQIRSHLKSKQFYIGITKMGATYNYASIALDYYRKSKSN